jgi:hypothetical protein
VPPKTQPHIISNKKIVAPNAHMTKKFKVSFIRIEKSPFSRWRRNNKANTSSGSHRKNQTRETKNEQKMTNTHRYEQKCQSHTCARTINSSMYDSDLIITTSPLTSSAPYIG